MRILLSDMIKHELMQCMTLEEFAKMKQAALKICFLRDTKLPSSLYQLYIINENKQEGLTQKQVWSIENIIRNSLTLLPNVKAFIAVSTTSSHDARRKKKPINGRQRTVVEGTKVATHVHIGAVGNHRLSARSYMIMISDRLASIGIKSRWQSKGNSYHAMNYLDYCRRQADSFHQYGKLNFDFREYMLDDWENI